jgi:hypothetical protein
MPLQSAGVWFDCVDNGPRPVLRRPITEPPYADGTPSVFIPTGLPTFGVPFAFDPAITVVRRRLLPNPDTAWTPFDTPLPTPDLQQSGPGQGSYTFGSNTTWRRAAGASPVEYYDWLPFPDVPTLSAVLVQSAGPRVPGPRTQAPQGITSFDEPFTLQVPWLPYSEPQPQPRRRPVPEGAYSSIFVTTISDDMTLLGSWRAPDQLPLPMRRQVRAGIDDNVPSAPIIDLPKWPPADAPLGPTRLRGQVRPGDSPSGGIAPPDPDLAIWGAWNVPSQRPTLLRAQTQPGNVSGAHPWFDSLIVDVLQPRWQSPDPRRPSAKPQAGTLQAQTEMPVTVKTDAAQYLSWAEQQPRPRAAWRVPADGFSIDLSGIIGGQIAPAVGGPYTVLVGAMYTSGAVVGQVNEE